MWRATNELESVALELLSCALSRVRDSMFLLNSSVKLRRDGTVVAAAVVGVILVFVAAICIRLVASVANLIDSILLPLLLISSIIHNHTHTQTYIYIQK